LPATSPTSKGHPIFRPKGGAFGFSADCGDEIQSGNVIHETNQPIALQ
jgi:hypothetical protein